MRTRKVKASTDLPRLLWEPVWTLPRTAEAYDAMVEQMAKVIYVEAYRRSFYKPTPWKTLAVFWQNGYRASARAALRAIGITRPKQ